MPYPITCRENVKSRNVLRGIVGHDLGQSTPSAEELLKDKVSDNSSRVGGCCSSFRVQCHSALSVDHILIASNLGHQESVDMNFVGTLGMTGGIWKYFV